MSRPPKTCHQATSALTTWLSVAKRWAQSLSLEPPGHQLWQAGSSLAHGSNELSGLASQLPAD